MEKKLIQRHKKMHENLNTQHNYVGKAKQIPSTFFWQTIPLSLLFTAFFSFKSFWNTSQDGFKILVQRKRVKLM